MGDAAKMRQHKLDLLLAYVRILARCNQVHYGADTAIYGVKRAVSGQTCGEQYLNQVISKVSKVLFLILDAYGTEVINNLTRMVEERRR